MHAIPKELKPMAAGGVVLNIQWFIEDPGDDRDKQPDLHDQVLIHAPSVSAVTDEMIQGAIAKRLPDVQAELAPDDDEPPEETRAMLGKVFDAAAVSATVEQRRDAKAVKRG